MKKRKVLSLVSAAVAAVFVLAGFSGCGGNGEEATEGNVRYTVTEKGTPEQYGSLSILGLEENEMPITGFIGPQDLYQTKTGYNLPSTITDPVYEKLSEAGVNLIIETKHDFAGITEGSAADRALKMGEKYGIQYILRDTKSSNVESADPNQAFNASAETIAQRMEDLYSRYPAISGLYVRDEPPAILFDKVGEATKAIQQAAETVGKDYVYYANLFPNTSGAQLSGDPQNPITYTEYIDEYCEKTDPIFLMYDLYPFEGLEGTISGAWFSTLAQYRAKAEELNVPFWLWLQAGGEWPDALSKRMVTESELLWSINTALCMGAKGLGYFPLVMPPEYLTWNGGIQNSYNAGLINEYGTANPCYYYAVKAARQLKAVDDVLMQSKNMGVMVHGETPSPVRGEYVLKEFRQLKSVSGDACLIGCFDYQGGTALYVVNYDRNNKSNVTLNFADNYGYEVIQRAKTAEVMGKSLNLTLECGEGVLVVLK